MKKFIAFFEIPTVDFHRAVDFYETVFGVQLPVFECEEEKMACFTEEGEKKAEAVYEKHRVITDLFIGMGANEVLAEQNACRIEHVISEEMFDVLKAYYEKLQSI